MAIKSLFVIFLFSSFLISCAQAPKINFRNKPEHPGRKVPVGQMPTEEVPESETDDKTVTFETKASDKPFRPKLTLVLGPGVSRSFAHIGVLKELKAAEIPVHSVIGMGMSALVAAEYVDQKSVHGLEWKASRSEDLKKLSETSFWSSKIKEKNTSDLEPIIAGLLTDYKARASRRGEFSCPLLSKRKKDLIFSDKRGLKNCVATPPLFNPGKAYGPYLFDLEAVRKGAIEMGGEKVVYIDVLSKNPNLFGSKESLVDGSVYWYWAFVAQITSADRSRFDKVVDVDVDSEILSFKSILESVRKGQSAGADLVDFLREEYQY